MTSRAFTVEIFCQGKGWQRISNLAPVKDIFGTEEEARKAGAYMILDGMKKSTTQRYGSFLGDMVGFRIISIETEEIPESLSQHEWSTISWGEVKHLFDKRHLNVYFIVKTWAFPD